MLANTEDIIISTNKATIQTDIPIYFQIDGEYHSGAMKNAQRHRQLFLSRW
jgi:diacylglycerol kinase family enzyme